MKKRASTIDNLACITVIVVAAILAIWLLLGCETVENPDGTVTQRVDTRAIREGLDAGQGAYQFYRDQQRPMHDQPAYQQRLYHQGQIITPQYQQPPAYYP